MNVGSQIGQYRIVKKLGAGGMGAVYLGEHILLGRRAAIKTLQPALSRDHEIADRFFNEARATSTITDPGVVQIFDFGYHVDGTAYIVLELLEGETLATRLERLHQLDPGEALRIARQVAASLVVAHERGIVHRDLKPDNIFLIRDAEARDGERTKVLDFGICKLPRGDVRITDSGAMVGTPVYMSPEQCRGGSARVDHRSDIYALGCVLFHLLTGRAPFEHDAPGDFIVSHMQSPAPVPSALVPALPPPIDALLARCLAKAPGDRFQTMAELHAAIECVAERIGSSAPDHATVHPAFVLGAGYRSMYDASLGSAVPARDEPAGAPPRLKVSLLKLVAAAAVLVLVIGAVVASRVEVGGASAVAEPSYRYTGPIDPRPASVARSPMRAPEPVTAGDAAPPFEQLITEPRSAKSKRAPRHRARVAPATEDLYDTR